MTSSRKKPRQSDIVDWKAVGERIRELRGFHMTQLDFAHSIEVSQSYLSNMEHGRVEVGAAILLRISRQSGRSIEWLLTGNNDVNPSSSTDGHH
jgi:transcriptional regulator with XRE-family HTH domain